MAPASAFKSACTRFTCCGNTTGHGQRIGKRLFAAVTGALKRTGYDSFMLWVLGDNPTLGFHHSQGGRVIGEKTAAIGGDNLTELAVGWDAVE